MKIPQLRIENCDLSNKRAKGNGMFTERGNAAAFGNTKAECIADVGDIAN